MEYDKLIDRQLERAAITSISGCKALSGGLEGAVLAVKEQGGSKMAESMSGQIFSIACALSKADEGEKALLEMICKGAGGTGLRDALKEGVTREDCESAFICAAAFLSAAAIEECKSGRGGGILPARGRPDGDEALCGRREQTAWRGCASRRGR